MLSHLQKVKYLWKIKKTKKQRDRGSKNIKIIQYFSFDMFFFPVSRGWLNEKIALIFHTFH